MELLLSIADFLDSPDNVLLTGLSLGIFAMVGTAGLMWIFAVPRKIGRWFVIGAGVLTVIAIETILWSFVIWYNTPLGESLNLK